MRTPFIRLPVPITDPTAPVITGAGPVFPPPLETGALAHWQFGGDANCLRDLVGGHMLTPAGVAPTYAANYLDTADGGLNGLISTVADRKTWTAALLVQIEASEGVQRYQPLLSQATSDPGQGGSMIVLRRSSNNLVSSTTFLTRPGTNYEIGVSAASDGFFNGLAVGDWVALFMGRSEAAGRFQAVPGSAARGGSADYRQDDTPATYTASTRNFAIGNAYYDHTDYKSGAAISEAIMWGSRLTQAQCLAAARRMVARAAYRGLTVAAVG